MRAFAKGKPFLGIKADGYDWPVFSEAYLYGIVFDGFSLSKGDARFILAIAYEYAKVISILGTDDVCEILDYPTPPEREEEDTGKQVLAEECPNCTRMFRMFRSTVELLEEMREQLFFARRKARVEELNPYKDRLREAGCKFHGFGVMIEEIISERNALYDALFHLFSVSEKMEGVSTDNWMTALKKAGALLQEIDIPQNEGNDLLKPEPGSRGERVNSACAK